MTVTENQPKEFQIKDLSESELYGLSSYLVGKPDYAEQLVAVRQEIHDRLGPLRDWAGKKADAAPHVPSAEPEALSGDEEPAQRSLKDRPSTIDEIVGQVDVVNRIRMVVIGSQIRGAKIPHVLIAGPAGFGKTTIAKVIAHEVGVPLVETNASTGLKNKGELVSLLMQISEPTCLFIDEVHALPTAVMEGLYTAMEDGKVDMMQGSGSDAVPHTFEVPGLIVVGATTVPGKLTIPMRDRFGLKVTMDAYSDEDLAEIVRRGMAREDVSYAPNEPLAIAQRAKGAPRLTLSLAELALNVAAVNGSPDYIGNGEAADALAAFGITANGLDEIDFRILKLMTKTGKAIGLDNLAQALDLDKITLADQYEPYLVRQGYIWRTSRGRMATEKAFELVQSLSEAA